MVGLGAGAIAFSAGNWALHRGARCATGDGAGTLLAASHGRWPWQDYAGRVVRPR